MTSEHQDDRIQDPIQQRSQPARRVAGLAAMVAAGALMAACPAFERGDPVPPPEPEPDVTADVTADMTGDGAPEVETVSGPSFEDEVYPILFDECSQCHTEGGPRPFFLTDDATDDYESIAKLVDPDDPASSKLLVKGTAEKEHGGGPVLDVGSSEYSTILAWIAAGAGP